jgi:Flp pilus assembly protein TadG
MIDPATRQAHRWRTDEGSYAVELAAAFAAWVLGVGVLAVAYQIQASGNAVAHAAREAARAASLAADPGAAVRLAGETAGNRLAQSPCEPSSVGVDVDITDFRAGGTVTVSVACRTDPPIGPVRTLRSSADEIVDRYRGGV